METQKEILHRYLQVGRDALLWKLDGLNEYDLRRPLVSSGTNLLGLVKHVASIEIGYFTSVFGRDCPVELPWFSPNALPNDDMWATKEDSSESIVSLYKTSWTVSDQTITELSLDSPGHVDWWSEARRDTTLQAVLIHMIAETHRHVGHADIIRENIDDSRGWNSTSNNLPPFSESEWGQYRKKIESVAKSFVK